MFLRNVAGIQTISKPDRALKLTEQLTKQFAIDKNCHFSRLYLLSNESGFPDVLRQLREHPSPVTDPAKIRVALLFGESHFLSMMPELAKHADIVLMADIDHRIHYHTKKSLELFLSSKDSQEYLDKHRTVDWKNDGSIFLLYEDQLIEVKKELSLCDDDYYLASDKRFEECKEAASSLLIANINLDFYSLEKCKAFADMLEASNAQLTICNFTNIHSYTNPHASPDDQEQYFNMHHNTASVLLSGSPGCFIMYSRNPTDKNALNDLSTNITTNITDYFENNNSYLPEPVKHQFKRI